MNLFPLNLVLATAVACATIFLGFLPVKTLRHTTLARATLLAAFAWGFVAMSSPKAIFHYPLGVAGLSLLAWWQFRRDEPFGGKMWLSMASGLGISLGVMLLMAVTPFAYPAGEPSFQQGQLIASIYLGGAVIGLAYVCATMIDAVPEVNRKVLRRYADLLLFIAGVRLFLVLLHVVQVAAFDPERRLVWHAPRLVLPQLTYDLHAAEPREVIFALTLLLLIAPVLTVMAWTSIRAARLARAHRWLIALAITAFGAELLARHLAL